MLEKQTMPIKKEMNLPTEGKSPEVTKTIKKTTLNKKIFSLIVFVLFIVITIIAISSSYQLYKVKSPNYQKQVIEKQTKDTINAVGKLIELPSDIPQIATVTDADLLKKNQPFFDNTKNGDQVLVFQKQVIVYRPSINKIINVGPII